MVIFYMNIKKILRKFLVATQHFTSFISIQPYSVKRCRWHFHGSEKMAVESTMPHNEMVHASIDTVHACNLIIIIVTSFQYKETLHPVILLFSLTLPVALPSMFHAGTVICRPDGFLQLLLFFLFLCSYQQPLVSLLRNLPSIYSYTSLIKMSLRYPHSWCLQMCLNCPGAF